jgi:cytochrome c556
MIVGKKWTFVAASVGVLLMGASAVLAQDLPGVIADRQALMKKQGADTKAIGDYAKGVGDQAKAQAAIDDLLAANAKLVGLFPAGTSANDFPGKTGAKPEIWSDHDGFVKAVATLHDAEVAEAAAIKSGVPADVAAGMAGIGKTGCGGCHSVYREKLPG